MGKKYTILGAIYLNMDNMSAEDFKRYMNHHKQILLEQEKKQIIDSANHQRQIRTMGDKPAYQNGAEYFDAVFAYKEPLTNIEKVIIVLNLTEKLENSISVGEALYELNITQKELDTNEYSFITDVIDNVIHNKERKKYLVHEDFINYMFKNIEEIKRSNMRLNLNSVVLKIKMQADKENQLLFPKNDWNEFTSKYPIQEWFDNIKEENPT